jgi:hypothetical protein
MSDIVLNKELSGGVTNFQVVGCTIDVGTKIYAARVDALHQNTYQVLSGLNHQASDEHNEMANKTNSEFEAETNTNNDDENLDDSTDNPNGKKAKAAKKRRLKKSTYIISADNIDSITLKMRDEFKDVSLINSNRQ